MKGFAASMAGLSVLFALSAAPVFAQPAPPPPDRRCCNVPAGTMVEVELADLVSTRTDRSGDTFALRLAAPLIINGRVVLRRGVTGVGVVIQSSRPGMGGKAGKLVLAARYLALGGERVPLRGLQLSGAGRDRTNPATVVGLSGFAFAPLGLVGLAVPGGNVDFAAGTRATAKLASDVFLPAMAWTPPYYGPPQEAMDDAAPAVEVPPPPPGAGEVVFFRRKSLLGVGQWFNVRERGRRLGKLTNGAYFVQIVDPGVHTYTATTEPQIKDHLTLQVDPGETYFVEGVLTKGLVMGEADLTPSDPGAFARALGGMKPAPRPRAWRAGGLPAAAPETPRRAENEARSGDFAHPPSEPAS